MYITRPKAIEIAIDAISRLPDSNQNRQAIERLINLQNDCKAMNWTARTVHQVLSEWRDSHGRNPTVTDLTEPGMPKAVTIKKIFDMKASAFLNIYYPKENNRQKCSKYTVKPKEEWISDFVAEFNRIKPKSAKDYNAKRDPGSPTWLTIARYLKLSTWKDLLEITGVKKEKSEVNHTYTVTHYSPAYTRIEELLKDRDNKHK